MGATNVGVRRAHSYLWSLSSPQQPLRRRIHQPSLLPHNITRKTHAPQESHFHGFTRPKLSDFEGYSRGKGGKLAMIECKTFKAFSKTFHAVTPSIS